MQNKPGAHLKKITDRAKQIRRAHPNTKWISAVKKASEEIRTGKKVGSVKKKAAKETVTKKTVIKKTVNKKRISGVATEHRIYTVRDSYEQMVKNDLKTIDNIKSDKNLTPAQRKVDLKKWRKCLAHDKKMLRQQNSHINAMLR